MRAHPVTTLAALAVVFCGDSTAPAAITDDPQLDVCQRGDLTAGVPQNAAIESTDCQSASTGVRAEVWRFAVTDGLVGVVSVTATFDAVLVLYTAQGVLIDATDFEYAGGTEYAETEDAGAFLIAVAGFDTTSRGPYSIQMDPIAPVAGLYEGTYTVPSPSGGTFTGDLTLSIYRTGMTLGGSWWSAGGYGGTLAGSVEAGSVSFALTSSPPCAGSFTGTATATVAGSVLTGTFSGSDCDGAFSATFQATRSGP